MYVLVFISVALSIIYYPLHLFSPSYYVFFPSFIPIFRLRYRMADAVYKLVLIWLSFSFSLFYHIIFSKPFRSYCFLSLGFVTWIWCILLVCMIIISVVLSTLSLFSIISSLLPPFTPIVLLSWLSRHDDKRPPMNDITYLPIKYDRGPWSNILIHFWRRMLSSELGTLKHFVCARSLPLPSWGGRFSSLIASFCCLASFRFKGNPGRRDVFTVHRWKRKKV